MTVWAGSLFDKTGLPPPPNSWAANPNNEIGIWHITINAGGSFTLPAAAGGAAITRVAYFIEGERLSIGENSLNDHCAATIDASRDAVFRNTHVSTPSEILVLQGKPIGEPVAQHGPFVMNTQAEIQQAFLDYRKTQFGGWSWPEDAMIFPREKQRFSLLNGVETYPPSLR